MTVLLPVGRGQRVVAMASFVHSFGTGLSVAAGALFFTRIVGLPASQVAGGLFAAAMTGLGAGVYVGRLADRWGPKRVQIAVAVCGTVVNTGLLLVHTFWTYLLVSMLSGAVVAASWSTLAPLVRGFGGPTPVVFRGYLRSVGNLAIALGAVAAGFAIQLDTRAAFLTVMIGRSLTYLVSGLVLLWLPPFTLADAGSADRGWAALRDRTYLAATAVNAVMSLHFTVPTFLLPLWIAEHTSAPRWTISAMLVLNTVLVVVLQVRFSRNVGDVPSAGRAMRWAGMALAAGLVLMALAEKPPCWLAVLLLAAGVTAYTLGEIWHTAASAEYSFGLAPADAQGQYAGVFGLGHGLAEGASPAVMSALPLALGLPGWLALATLLLATGLTCRSLMTHVSRPTLAPTAEAPAREPDLT
ncbi:MFS transporter [Streptomyces sp. NBC_01431]|uniref:MFS transporter n=1 Tax=Streptomyces sp. NBC_01431 TaxID=2903863 RepID=UPI002E2EFEA9|nr:MFS transporter [Streptomyces sp. NBC_01431]